MLLTEVINILSASKQKYKKHNEIRWLLSSVVYLNLVLVNEVNFH